MGLKERRKGRRFEQDLVNIFKRKTPTFEVERCYQYDIGHGRPDIKAGPFWIEAKHGKTPNPRAALRQVESAADGQPDALPIAIIKDDHQEPFVVMRLSVFFRTLLYYYFR